MSNIYARTNEEECCINLEFILNEIFVKFIAMDDKFIILNYKEYFVTLEEARWYMMDFYGVNTISLLSFAEILFINSNIIMREDKCLKEIFALSKKELNDTCLAKILGKYYNLKRVGGYKKGSLSVNELQSNGKSNSGANKNKISLIGNTCSITFKKLTTDYFKYISYKKLLPSYGAIVFSSDYSKFLLVKQLQGGKYTFPKGKMAHNESPKDCAIREVYEETGVDIKQHITDLCVTIFGKITLFIATNVSCEIPTGATARNEISEVLWADIKDFTVKKFEQQSTDDDLMTDDLSNSSNGKSLISDSSIKSSQIDASDKKYKLVTIAFNLLKSVYEEFNTSLFSFKLSRNKSFTRNNKLYNSILKINKY